MTAIFRADSSAFFVAKDCMLALRVKGSILLDRACQLATGRISEPWPTLSDGTLFFESFWAEVKSLETHTKIFLHSLPSLYDARGVLTVELGEFTVEHDCKLSTHRQASVNPLIVNAHTMARETLMEIHHISASIDPVAYAMMVQEAEQIAHLVKRVEGMDVCGLIGSGAVCITFILCS